MKHYSHYDPDTGHFTGCSIFADQETIALNITGSNPVVEGRHDHRTHRVDLKTGKVVPREVPPEVTAVDRHHTALGRIHALEARQARVVRELLLGDAGAKEGLQAIDDEIAKLRADLK